MNWMSIGSFCLFTSLIVIAYLSSVTFKDDLLISEVEIVKGPDAIQYSNNSRSYEEGMKNCSRNILLKKKQLLKYLSRKNTPRCPCAFKFFNDYLKKYGYFYGEGIWYAPPNGESSSAHAGFYPFGCTFFRASRADYLLSDCFQGEHISKILVTGDSNGRKLTQEMIRLFKYSTGLECRKAAFQNAENDTDYFDVPRFSNSTIVTKPCGFKLSSCGSWQYQCQNRGPSNVSYVVNVTIEYIVSLHLIDSTLQLASSEVAVSGKKGPLSADNKLEYILKYYLPHKGFPDVWIISPPFHHEKLVHNLTTMETHINRSLNLLDTYVPKKTKLIFLASIMECPERVPAGVQMKLRTVWNNTVNEILDKINRLWYELIRHKIGPSKNWNVFSGRYKGYVPFDVQMAHRWSTFA